MLFPFPLELFPFPIVAQNYFHSHGNPTGVGIPIGIHTSSTYYRCRRPVDTGIVCTELNIEHRVLSL